ncbi:MAG: hypothetical protein CL912_16410 [Deltaproteobacteria bacterium]|nr:hypothetical protein [Deltaproteobacteria bacterium]
MLKVSGNISYLLHRPTEDRIDCCFPTHLEKLILLPSDNWILPKPPEIFARDRVDDIVVLFSSHDIVSRKDIVGCKTLVDTIETVEKVTSVNETTCQTETATIEMVSRS